VKRTTPFRLAFAKSKSISVKL